MTLVSSSLTFGSVMSLVQSSLNNLFKPPRHRQRTKVMCSKELDAMNGSADQHDNPDPKIL